MRWLVGILVALLALTPAGASSPPASAFGSGTAARTAPSTLPSQAVSDRFGEHTPVMVVLDTSGSMDEEVVTRAASGTRLDVAKSAVLGAVDALPTAQTYGLITYPGGTTVDGCEPGQIRTGLGPLDRVSAILDVRGMTADGGTPTGPALQLAAETLQAAGFDRATIVLVSDGESNCGAPPCEVVKDLSLIHI